MNKLLSLLSILAVIGFSSCTQQPSDPGSAEFTQPSSTSSPAHPALAYIGWTNSNMTTQSVAVMDTDGSHQTNIYAALHTGSLRLSAGGNRVSWSAAGDKVCFAENTATMVYAIRTVDVSVVNGNATGSNATTVYTTSASDSAYIYTEAFSSVSSTAKIAFGIMYNGAGGTHKYSRVYTIPSAGGSPTLLWQSQNGNHELSEITWNSDDSKIAFIDKGDGTPYNFMIRVINASTGAQTDSLPLNYYGILGLEWSRNGQDMFAISTVDASSGPTGEKIRYCATTSGSTPSAGCAGSYPTWSPNNSSVMVKLSGSPPNPTTVQKSTAYSTSSSLLTNTVSRAVRWKR